MLRLMRRLAGALVLAAGLGGAVASPASAASLFYVNQATGSDLNPCTSAAPCKTIGKAVERSELEAPGAATIEVAAGVYQELVNLSHGADNGITINGVGPSTEIEGTVAAKAATVAIVAPGNTTTLSNLSIVNPAGDEKDGIDSASQLTLDNVFVDIQAAGEGAGIFAAETGALTINGGAVTMESGTKGEAVRTIFNALSMNGTGVTLNNGAEGGGGIMAEGGPISLANVTVNLGNSAKHAGIDAVIGPVSISNVAVNVASGSKARGLEIILAGPLSANSVRVNMGEPSSTAAAVSSILSTGSLSHLEVGGSWIGPSVLAEGPLTLSDSQLVGGAAGTAPVAEEIGGGEGPGLLLQRDVLRAPTTAVAALAALASNATVDSSELLGGTSGVTLIHEEGKTRTVTIAGSTIDAGVLGTRDGPGVFGVSDSAGAKASTAIVNVEGSILLERQRASIGPSGKAATVTCAYSDVPSQTQAATATEGAINCANGAGGNTTTEPLTALFGAPVPSYGLNPGSSAIDSVPAGAIALPFGLTPSSTDLAGNPRVVDGNGDCVAVQDRGALELQGHAASCPAPPPPPAPAPLLSSRPAAPAITGLTISPSSFRAAPSGATLSAAKKRFGATVGYRDSQAATATFSVLRQSAGRRQGRSCRKPSSRNRRAKRCTILTAVGGFTHIDRVGANSLHFSGRLKGRKLAAATYTLQVVPANAAGKGKPVFKSFTVKR